MARIEPLNKQSHGNVKIKPSTDVKDIVTQSILPLVVGEFSSAAIEFPICFIKVPESDEFSAVALLGLEKGENLFVKDEKWDAAYMPARYTHKPFGLIKAGEGDQQGFQIAIDMDSELVSEEEGRELFNEDGSESEFLEQQKKAMGSYLEQEQLTKAFIKELQTRELLVAKKISLTVNGRKIDIDGINIIDEEKLNAVSDEDFLDMRKRGMLPAIYTHMISMRQVSGLIKRKTEREVAANA